MLNTSSGCKFDIDCPGTELCLKPLWFSDSPNGSGCTCARLYGWKGEDCTEVGVGTIFLYLVAILLILITLKQGRDCFSF
eukprot:snap_masked-scaffold_40-processed-gene-2.4-mRNA-1 protein AED:1.00 eAED:1.00 QI:0/0/0/0/1/1/3/0/79